MRPDFGNNAETAKTRNGTVFIPCGTEERNHLTRSPFYVMTGRRALQKQEKGSMTRIVYANIGYLRAIDGSIRHHLGRVHHHVYTPLRVQAESLALLTDRLRETRPDLCCLVEVDRGSFTNRFFDQLPALENGLFNTRRADSKYGKERRLSRFHHSFGKTNAFLSKAPVSATSRYLRDGTKTLVYDIAVEGIRVLLVHLSLLHATRLRQMRELAEWVGEQDGPCVVLGDFNVMRGERELAYLLKTANLVHANAGHEPTFRFGPYRASLDSCLVSSSLRGRYSLSIIDQPYSDHQMLMLDITPAESRSDQSPAPGRAALAKEAAPASTTADSEETQT